MVFFAVVEGKTLGVGGGRELGGPHYGCHHFVRRQGFLAVILKIPTFAGIALVYGYGSAKEIFENGTLFN